MSQLSALLASHAITQATFRVGRLLRVAQGEARVQADSSIVSIAEVANQTDHNANQIANRGLCIVLSWGVASANHNVTFTIPVLRVMFASWRNVTKRKIFNNERGLPKSSCELLKSGIDRDQVK